MTRMHGAMMVQELPLTATGGIEVMLAQRLDTGPTFMAIMLDILEWRATAIERYSAGTTNRLVAAKLDGHLPALSTIEKQVIYTYATRHDDA